MYPTADQGRRGLHLPGAGRELRRQARHRRAHRTPEAEGKARMKRGASIRDVLLGILDQTSSPSSMQTSYMEYLKYRYSLKCEPRVA